MHPADPPRSVAGRRIPRVPALDSTLEFSRDPYGFIAKRCRRSGADLFEARILLRQTLCMTGPEAAALFYDSERFQRKGATPLRPQATLLGRKGVQTLDGETHRARKHMLMALMRPENLRRLGDASEEWWRIYARKWERMAGIRLDEQAREILCRTACDWAGVPLADSEVTTRTAQLSALFESTGRVGAPHWATQLARTRAQRWAGDVIDRMRSGRLRVPIGSAAQAIATHRGIDGKHLDRRTAAVELLNVLRPTVAVATYVVFEALALHDHGGSRQKLSDGRNDEYLEWFVQEVRRFYPSFPSIAAIVRHNFDWKGYTFRKGRRALLDLYGTNHDPRAWEAPEAFWPERFASVPADSFAFIPQGGGDHELGHRCAGEWMTVELMKRAARFLVSGIDYEIPPQDLSIDMSRLPAMPSSGFVLNNVRFRNARPKLVSVRA